MQRFSPHLEPWGRVVNVKVNAVEALLRQLRRSPPGEVFISSACDGWQPVEAERELTRRCCELLLRNGFTLNVLTKSRLVRRDIDIFEGRSCSIGMTITTLREELRELWEPRASPVRERLDALRVAREAGLETTVMFGPLLPFLSDDERSLEEMFESALESGVQRFWVDSLNPRPRVWESVSKLLSREFPELLVPYRRILFEKQTRDAYLNQLHRCVEKVSKKLKVYKQVSFCF